MSRIKNISLQAIATKPLLTSKKNVIAEGINPRLAVYKPVPRISAMMTKKSSQNFEKSTEAPANQTKSSKASAQQSEVTPRPNSATITAPYTGTAKTRITVKYDVGFGNTLCIRGHGANLSWDKGIPMKNVKNDEWVWETDLPFTTAEFKILINDKNYETGRNHLLHCGTMVQYSPRF